MYGTTTSLIGGKQRTLKFNINADIEFERLHGLSGKTAEEREKIGASIGFIEYVRDAIYCALRSADLERGNTIDYNQYTVGEWITELEQAELERIVACKNDAKPQQEQTDKKKAE